MTEGEKLVVLDALGGNENKTFEVKAAFLWKADIMSKRMHQPGSLF